MTDPFEDAVRDALRGTTSGPGEMPTYHAAWNRGRRRRIIKRSALTAAGALMLLAALTVNLGRLPGGDSSESSDVVSSLEAATPVFEPTPLATTAPVETPDVSGTAVEPSAEGAAGATGLAPVNPDQAGLGDEPTTTLDDEPTPEPAEASPTAAPVVTPTTSPVAPQATVVPTPAVAPTPSAIPTAQDNEVPATAVPVPDNATSPEPTAQIPTPTAEALPPVEAATDQDPGSAAGTAQQPADPGSPDEPEPELDEPPQAAFTSGPAADAVLLTGAARGVALPCDLDQDGVADATCELLPDYPCTGDGDVQPGYSAVDTDGDGVGDTCMAMDLTVCDTNGDGMGDTPCIIDISPPPSDE